MKLRNRRRYLNWINNPLGVRCPGFHPGCMVCQMYRYYDEYKTFPSFDYAGDLATLGNRLTYAIETSSLAPGLKKQLLDFLDTLKASEYAKYQVDEDPLRESLLQALRQDARVKSKSAADVKGIVANGQRLSIEGMRP